MVYKKISRKIRIAKNLLKDDGILAVGIRTLEFAQKKTRGKIQSLKHGIDTSAIYEEVLSTNLSKPANKNWKSPKKTKKQLTINWLMPPPGKGSGGHMTLYRFISYLEKSGHKCRIYLHNPGPGSSVEAVKAVMGDSFPKIDAPMQWLKQDEQMEPADAIFATSWQTAYSIFNSKINAKKFYFVQDFEPLFYPFGSMYTLAENTYKMGLRGVTAGGWLAKRLHDEYGMVTDSFDFGSDSSIYKFKKGNARKEVVFYARPTTERRAFELGILTLDLFHRKHPDYTINFIGWDVSEFNIPFPHKNLGILTPQELNILYERCAASLVMSLTNMSLLPLELLSSGCIPVVNDGANNRLVSNNKYIAYANNDPLSLADKLSEVVSRNNLESYAEKASKSVATCSWDDSGDKVVSVIEKSVNTDGEK